MNAVVYAAVSNYSSPSFYVPCGKHLFFAEVILYAEFLPVHELWFKIATPYIIFCTSLLPVAHESTSHYEVH